MSDQDSQVVTQPTYTSYGQVPWYRKNWFALVCGLFFAPGLLYPLITGNFFYEKNGQVVGYTKIAKILLIVWASFITLALAMKVFGEGSVFEDKNIALVKNGTLQLCPSATVKQMVDGFMGDPSYEAGVGEDGQHFVNIGGDLTFHEKPVRGVIQFLVDEKEGTFQYQAFELNEIPQANLIAMAVLQKMCESAEKNPVVSSGDISGGQSSTPAAADEPITVAEIPEKSWAPSFNCEKSSTFAEKSICSDDLLGKLDGALSENYKMMLASDVGDGARSDLKDTQRKWLAERNKCTDIECLASAYKSRIDEVCEYPVISGIHPACTSSDEIN